MSKRTANLLDAALPLPPSVPCFLQSLNSWYEKMDRARDPDPLHQKMVPAFEKPIGSSTNEKFGVSNVIQFSKVCEVNNAVYDDLDGFLIGWAVWTLDPKVLFDKPEEIENFQKQRVQSCTWSAKQRMKHAYFCFIFAF